MGKAGDQGPRKLDNSTKQEYKDIGNSQATQAKEKTQQILQKSKQPEENKTEPKIDWRKGNFLEVKQENAAEQLLKQKQISESTYGANISSITEVKTTSKHAKRRANKKARQAEAQT